MQIFEEVKANLKTSYRDKILETLYKLETETGFKDIHKIILFGSVARGTDRSNSDIDICLITSDNISRQDRCEAKYIVFDDYYKPYVDCVTIRESEFRNNPDNWRLYNEIKKDGVLLYEST